MIAGPWGKITHGEGGHSWVRGTAIIRLHNRIFCPYCIAHDALLYQPTFAYVSSKTVLEY
jgi:hypothetical protein